MAWRIRLIEAIPDTAEKAGWWAMAFGGAGAFVALWLNDLALSVFGFLLAAAGGILPSVVGVKRSGKGPATARPMEEPHAGLDAYLRELKSERSELLVMQEDQVACDRLH